MLFGLGYGARSKLSSRFTELTKRSGETKSRSLLVLVDNIPIRE